MKRKEKPIYRDTFDGKGEVTFVSAEEMWFAWWCEELKQKGLLNDWQYQATTWEISAACNLIWQEQGARKMLDKSACLFRGHTYTADFTLDWNVNPIVAAAVIYATDRREGYREEFRDKTVLEIRAGNRGGAMVCSGAGPASETAGVLGTIRGYVDVKGVFVKAQSQDAKFSVLRGVVWDKYGEYVNKIVPHSSNRKMPKCLFRDTFVPRRFLFTDRTAQMRSIGYPVRSVDEWLKHLLGK